MAQYLGIVREMRSKLPSQSSLFARTSLLLVATLIGGSCSNINDDGASQSDDIATISALHASIVPLINSDGADGLFTLYTDDVVLMVPDSWADLDRQEALAFYTQGLNWAKPDPENYSISLDEVVVMGDWAYVRYTARGQQVPTSGGSAFSQGSRHVSLLRRQPDGAWKIARDIFHNPPLDDIEMEKNLGTRIASFGLLSESPISANLVEYWNCTQNEGVTDAQLWEASKTWMNVMNSMHSEVKGRVYLEFPMDGREGVGQFKFIVVLDDVKARAKYWSDLDNERVEKANMTFDALASCVDGAIVSSLEVTDE
jgi:uncharacterized protein (TIGR02246 family)